MAAVRGFLLLPLLRSVFLGRSPLFGLALLFGVAACSESGPTPPTDSPAVSSSVNPTNVPANPGEWWKAATVRASGRERVLAPRELRALLDEGRNRGFDRDADWWSKHVAWAHARILEVDPEDPDANAGVGNKTLQEIPGFREIWEKMLAADPTEEISELLDDYEVQVTAGRAVYLDEQEFALLTQRFRKAQTHLERVAADPEYVALRRALRQVRRGAVSDYPFVYVKSGPFLVFFTARDLQMISGEDEALERQRLTARRAFYRKSLEKWVGVYSELVADLAKAYPQLWKQRRPGKGDLFCQWVFGEREWYVSFAERVRKDGAEAPYRCGFYHGGTGWAYLYDPEAAGDKDGRADAAEVRRESAAYLAATQLLRHWGDDPNDRTMNRLDRSRAYWLKEGWPAYIATRQMKTPIVGRVFQTKWTLPPLRDVIQRRSRLDRSALLQRQGDAWDGRTLPGGGYTDLACHVVRWLHEHKKDALLRFLESQTGGGKRGIAWFEECFGIGKAGWGRFENGVYAGLR